mmetsp:Transcript_15370/g.44002  ORF Transcript_15370/g.44002 Transcript_15370/m.44002 type:complete len:379 (+) Transcript_15370:456-1592(+)
MSLVTQRLQTPQRRVVASLCDFRLAAEHFHRGVNLCQLLPVLVLSFEVRRNGDECGGPRHRRCKAVQLPLRCLELRQPRRVLLRDAGDLGLEIPGLVRGQELPADGLHAFAGGLATPLSLVVRGRLGEVVGPNRSGQARTAHGPQLNERPALLDGVVECLLSSIQVSSGCVHGLQVALNASHIDRRLLVLCVLGGKPLAVVPGQEALAAPVEPLGLLARGPGGLPGDRWLPRAAAWLLRCGWGSAALALGGRGLGRGAGHAVAPAAAAWKCDGNLRTSCCWGRCHWPARGQVQQLGCDVPDLVRQEGSQRIQAFELAALGLVCDGGQPVEPLPPCLEVGEPDVNHGRVHAAASRSCISVQRPDAQGIVGRITGEIRVA